jgi:hypothetical protein
VSARDAIDVVSTDCGGNALHVLQKARMLAARLKARSFIMDEEEVIEWKIRKEGSGAACCGTWKSMAMNETDRDREIEYLRSMVLD